jgi:pyrroloquinoline-quinone synthase
VTPHEFAAELRKTIVARRSFGGHPLWLRIAAGDVSPQGLRIFAQQFFLQVVEFPRAVSALHASCPYREDRLALAESLYEEETGRISGCNLPHPDLFARFASAVGVGADELAAALPLPSTAALIDWFQLSTRTRPFLEGAAAITLAAEGQVPGAFGAFARDLEKHYGLKRDDVAFWDIHEIADADHSEVGDSAVTRYAEGAETQARVRDAVARSLEAWWLFFDGMERAIDAQAESSAGD